MHQDTSTGTDRTPNETAGTGQMTVDVARRCVVNGNLFVNEIIGVVQFNVVGRTQHMSNAIGQ